MDLAQTVEDFHRDGFVRVPGLLSEGELRALQHDTQHIIDGGYEDVANSTDYRTAPDPDTGKDVFNRVQFVFRWPPRSPIRCSRCSAIRRCWHIPMRAGDVLVHDIRLVHGSHRSRSERLRPHPLLRVPVPGLDAARRGPAGCGTRIDGTWGKARIRLTRHAIEDPQGVSLRGGRDSVRLPGAGGIRCRAAFR